MECVFVRLQRQTAEAPNAYATRRSMLPSFAFCASIVCLSLEPDKHDLGKYASRVVTNITHSAVTGMGSQSQATAGSISQVTRFVFTHVMH
jgi:hypothetical protein